METRAHYVAVGAFVLAMVVLAFATVLWLARGELTTHYAHYYIYFEGPVTGLRSGAPVEYNGVPVGKVADVRIDPNNVEQIRVTVEIDPKVPIKTDARASVETNLLSGVSFIQIVKGTREAPLLRPKKGEEYAVIHAHRSRLASVTRRAPELLEKLNQTADRLNELLSDKNRQAVTESLGNIKVLTADLAKRDRDIAEFTANANNAAKALSDLLQDFRASYAGPDGLVKRLTRTVGNVDRLTKNLADTSQQLQLTLKDMRPGLRTFSQQTLSDVGSLVAEARQLVSGLGRVTAELERNPSRILFGDRREGYRPQ